MSTTKAVIRCITGTTDCHYFSTKSTSKINQCFVNQSATVFTMDRTI